MNFNPQFQLNQYNHWTLEQILTQAVSNGDTHSNLEFAMAMGKAKIQQVSSQSLALALQLFERSNPKWLDLVGRFAESDFKLVFSFCIKNLKTYPALIHPVLTQGDHERQAMLENNIQNAFDQAETNDSLKFTELCEVYIEYLRNWIIEVPHRTLHALERIQNRLRNSNNIYQKLVQPDLIKFTSLLAQIINFHECFFMRKFQLRKFWSSIPQAIEFMKQVLSEQGKGMIQKAILDLQFRSSQTFNLNLELQKQQQQRKEENVLFLKYTSQVFILQETFLHNAERLANELAKTYVIDYWTFNKENKVGELVLLQNSLIYQVLSDDLPSLIQQLLSSLAKNIPSFLTHFLNACEQRLFKGDLDEISTSDIVLKLCILSKQIVHHFHSNEESISIKEIISQLVNLSDSRSELVQIKTLKLMHYFKEILPEKNYTSYHEIIFRVIKRYIINEIQKSQQHDQQQNEFSMFEKFQLHQSIYTKISFHECMKILQEETQKQQDSSNKAEMRIRRAKFSNKRFMNDPMKQNENWISDKFLELMSLEGYCEEQLEVFRLYRSFLEKYPTVSERNTCSILRVLSDEFGKEFERLRNLNQHNKKYQKLFEIVNSMIVVAKQINEDTFSDCETILVPILTLLKESYEIIVEKQLLKILQILIDKAGRITPDLGNLIVFTQEILKKGSSGMTELQGIILKLCKPSVAKNIVEEDWNALVEMFANLFRDYIAHMVNNSSFHVYETQWIKSLSLAQLFFQTYEEQFQLRTNLDSTLLEIQFYIEKTLPSQVGFQMLMTIHHISRNSRMNEGYLKSMVDVNSYSQKYSLNLLIVAMTNILSKNFKQRIFQYDQSRETEHKTIEFVNIFADLRRVIAQKINEKESSPNDSLPLGKVNGDRYIDICVGELLRSKLIDVSQAIEIKNKLLDDNFLVKREYFQ